MLYAILRRPWTVLGVAALAGLVVLALRSGSEPHHIQASFQAATLVRDGQDVQIDGIDVGKVADVRYRDGRAIVRLGIADEHWPLHRGTKAILRFGTTAGNGTRRVDLVPGPDSAPAIPEDGLIATRDTVTPVEFDEVFNMLDAPTRRTASQLVRRTADGLAGREADLRAGLRTAPAAIAGAGDVLDDLARDQAALDGLVTGAHRLTRTLAPRGAEITDLITVAATTFDVLARNAGAVRASIDELPATLTQARGTLARLDRSLTGVRRLAAAVAPGTRRLPGLATDLRSAAGQLRVTAPAAVDVADRAIAAVPPATRLLRRTAPFTAELGPILADLAPMVACIRPYVPEVAGALSDWAAFSSHYDALSHYARVQANGGASSLNADPLTSAQLLSVVPGLKYALPRPPGLNAGQPWFLPQCGAGRDALDPRKDPEAR